MRMDVEADMTSRAGVGQRDIAPPSKVTGKRAARTVIVVHVVFRYSIEQARQDILRINKAFGKIKRLPVLHGDRQCGWVCETQFTADQIMDLLRDCLSAGCVENAWAWTPGADIASILPLDPLTDRVREAWRNVRDWNRAMPRRAADGFLATARPIPGGTAITRVLDDHPLERSRLAAGGRW
jgi:hypothetical protein